MHFNEPKLTGDLRAYESFIFQYEKFDKEKHYCIDGFPKPDATAIVVLDAPKFDQSKYSYLSIQKSVLILENEGKDDDQRDCQLKRSNGDPYKTPEKAIKQNINSNIPNSSEATIEVMHNQQSGGKDQSLQNNPAPKHFESAVQESKLETTATANKQQPRGEKLSYEVFRSEIDLQK